MKTSVALLALFLAGPSFAENYADIVNEAFSSVDEDFHKEWAFTETTIEEGIRYVGRYDPGRSAGERWTLISIDNREPTAEEMADFLDYKEDHFQRERDNNNDDDHELDVVDFDTLELAEKTANYWIFSFVPNGDIDDDDDETAQKFMQQVSGSIKIVRGNDGGVYPEYLDLRNDKPIKPAFSVKISRFLTRLTFGPAADGGPIVPLTIEVEVKGRAMMVVGIDESERTVYSDFEHVGD